MKRLGGVLCLALAAAVAGSVGRPVAVAKEPPVRHASAVLALVGGEIEQPKLVWLNPRTLERLKRGAVPLGTSAYGGVFSPTGGRLAIGGSAALGVRIVDIFRMKLLRRAAKRIGDWSLTPVGWPTPRRLLVVESNIRTHGQTLLVVDPVLGRVRARVPLDFFSRWGVAGRSVVFLGEPVEGIGSARLLVADPNGQIRSVVLGQVAAGGQQEGPEDDPTYRIASPGLAVDPEAERAYVVGQDDVVAEVDLRSLDVAYRDLSRRASLLGRLHAWLEPTARAKAVTGWSHQAAWLGGGRIAVAGSRYEGERSEPEGLALFDVNAGTVDSLEPRASLVVAADGVLLAAGAGRDGETETGMGIAAFTPGGARLWHALGNEPVWWTQVAGGYAYVAGPDEYPPTVRVVDLADGAVRTLRGQTPYFVPDAP